MMKKLVLVVPLLIATFFVKAQFSNQQIIANTLIGSGQVHVVDVNNDGNMDIVTQSNGGIVWYENLGNSNIDTVQNIITLDPSGVYIDCIDMDNDGDIDVVAGSDDDVAWYENIQNGIFGGKQMISTEVSGEVFVKGSDMDNDGDIDVVSISSFDYKVAWYENSGGQYFLPQVVIEVGSSSSSAHEFKISDFDNDGDNDIITSYSGFGGIYWNENLGGGVFTSNQTLISSGQKPHDISIIDVNTDGIDDLIYSSANTLFTHYIINTGGGNWNGSGIVVRTRTFDRHEFDVDNDGDLDVISRALNYDIIWNENLTTSFDTVSHYLRDTLTGSYFSSGDLDTDGDIDVVYRGSIHALGWYENLGGTIDTVDKNINGKPVDSPKEIYAVDIDNDGDNDVISASFWDDKIAWYENLGQGVFDYQKIICDSALGANAVFASDLDNDGDMDIISGSYEDKKIAWYENLGLGNFSSQNLIGLSYHVKRVYAADIDNDMDNDIVSVNSGGLVIFHENLGLGNFAQNDTIISLSSARSVSIADLNNDGNKDIIVCSTGSTSRVFWIENFGGGIFDSIPDTVGYQYLAEAVFVSDYDNDGDIDVFSCGYTSSGVAPIQVFENLGLGNFGAPINVDNLKEMRYIYSDDVDGDSFDDILVVNKFGVSWYKNDGMGAFGSEEIITQKVGDPLCVITSDLDGDGDNDVISSSFLDNKIAWYENFFSNPKFKGITFYDANQNGLFDSTEIGLNFIQTHLQPNAGYSYSDSLGSYFHSAIVGIPYVLGYDSFPNWYLTSDSATYNRQLSVQYQIIDSLNFGFYPDTILSLINPDLIGSFPRCNDTVNYWVNIQNQGTTLPSGIIHLQLDDSITYISSAITPDSINGQNIYWHYDSLFFFDSEMINLQVLMPPFTSIGDTLSSYLTVHEVDTFNNIVYTNTDTLDQILVCAYDPNDKSVSPKGKGVEGFISQNQELEYLIRFQNTGNDTAITVMIRDQLDENLDWSTLQPIASSHNMQVWIEQDGEAVFKFENIMLPDSNVDFLGSQGFVKFSIQPDTGLAPLTPIYNTANIYFDFNPAVVTNTVLNTIECYSAPLPVISYNFPYLDAGVTGNYTYQWYLNDTLIVGATNDTLTPIVDGDYTVEVTDSNGCFKISLPYTHTTVGLEEKAQLNTLVYPNPFKESTTILFSKSLNKDYDLLVYNIVGAEVYRFNKIASNSVEINKNDIGKGMFLTYLIHNQTGERIFIEKLIVQ